MTHVLIIDQDFTAEQVHNHAKGPFVTAKGHCPIEIVKALDVQTFDRLDEAVKGADAVTIAVGSEQWDKVLLGADGILTTITEGAEIYCAADLDDAKQAIYASFLASKNLSFVPMTA
ncbi:MAG: hypothetical protein WA790_17540 [Sulfitobacter sp.]